MDTRNMTRMACLGPILVDVTALVGAMGLHVDYFRSECTPLPPPAARGVLLLVLCIVEELVEPITCAATRWGVGDISNGNVQSGLGHIVGRSWAGERAGRRRAMGWAVLEANAEDGVRRERVGVGSHGVRDARGWNAIGTCDKCARGWSL